jgi:hypothetical protein
VPEHQEARQSAAGAVTWRKSLPPKCPLDTQDACILIGLLAVVVGIALFSLAGRPDRGRCTAGSPGDCVARQKGDLKNE